MNKPLEFSGGEKQTGFSLSEVVIALALVAVSIPTIISLFGTFTNLSGEIRGRDELGAIVNEVTLYLENEAGSLDDVNHFDKVYEWVKQASEGVDQAQVLYYYLSAADSTDYKVSPAKPGDDEISSLDGRIVAIELLAPQGSILSSDDIGTDISAYNKAYLPLELHIYGLASPVDQPSKGNYLDTFPIVLSR